MSPPSSPYRDGSDAARRRLAQLRSSLAEVDAQLAVHAGALPLPLRRKLSQLREQAEPVGTCFQDLARAEQAAMSLENEVDDALGLAAVLGRSVNPVLPPRTVWARWAARTTLSCTLIVFFVLQAGLADFMLLAFGMKVQRATATLPCDRLGFEAQRAAGITPTREHAHWVDPE